MILMVGSSGFNGISETTSLISLGFACGESMRTHLTYFKTPASILTYSKLHLYEEYRVASQLTIQIETLPHNYFNLESLLNVTEFCFLLLGIF